MNDSISRQDAIIAIAKLLAYHGSDGAWIGQKEALDVLKSLPSAEPTQTNTLESLDCISRQAAIDAVRSYYDECDTSDKSIEERIEDLPSAQPKQRWIPVTERLPLYGQDVLAVRTYWDGEKCQEVLTAHIAIWNEETGAKWWNATNITHWMPLPEPPMGGET